MLRKIGLGFSLAVGSLTVATACSEGSDSPAMASQSESGPSAWCNAACSYSKRCSTPVTGICTGCAQGYANYFSYVKNEFLLKEAACFDAAPCPDWEAVTKSCYTSVSPTVTPTSAVIDFCKSMSAKFFDCFFGDDDLTFCVGDFAAWSDAGVTRAKACAAADCATLNECLGNAFTGANSP